MINLLCLTLASPSYMQCWTAYSSLLAAIINKFYNCNCEEPSTTVLHFVAVPSSFGWDALNGDYLLFIPFHALSLFSVSLSSVVLVLYLRSSTALSAMHHITIHKVSDGKLCTLAKCINHRDIKKTNLIHADKNKEPGACLSICNIYHRYACWFVSINPYQSNVTLVSN